MAGAIEPVYEAFGRLVRARRIQLGWTQERLGGALGAGMTRASIANIEAGKQRALLHTAIELAAALEIPLADLLPSPAPSGPDAVAEELESKLSISPHRARSIASGVTKQEKP